MAAGKEKVFLGRSQTMKTAFGEFKKVSFELAIDAEKGWCAEVSIVE